MNNTNGVPIVAADDKDELNRKAKRTLLWFGMISIIMLFAGLTSAYMVREGEGKWIQFDLPKLFILSTIIIVLSSFPMQWAVNSAKKNQSGNLKAAVVLTFILGIGFVIFQYLAWQDLVSQGIYLVGKVKDITGSYTYIAAGTETLADAQEMGNVSASFLYVITDLHVAHVLGGILALTVVLIKSLNSKYSASNYNGVRVCAIYWHFLGALWIYLFLFLLFIR